MRILAHLIISGRVQGVGYRAWAFSEATRRQLDGWVRNRLDGTVEALLAGDLDSVREMIAACGRGPLLARVDSVVQSEGTEEPAPGFRTLPTAGARA